MPYHRPTLTELRDQAVQYAQSQLPGSDPLLRFNNISILCQVVALLLYDNYGYQDWISQQAVPFTATGEFLEAWAAIRNIFRKPATYASGGIQFQGTVGATIPAGAKVVRGDGATGTILFGGTFTSTGIVLAATMDSDPNGVLGAFTDSPVGTLMSLEVVIANVQSEGVVLNAFVGGADLESDDSLRQRMLLAFQSPPHGGDQADYIEWALAIPGVTRAWCAPNTPSSGDVTVYPMLDVSESAFDGFPQGSNGVSQNDSGPGGTPRDTVATGDQLLVADGILAAGQPVTALVYVVAPTAQSIAFTIQGTGFDATVEANITAALEAVMFEQGQVKAVTWFLQLGAFESAVFGAWPDAYITVPAVNLPVTAGNLPTVGTITFAS